MPELLALGQINNQTAPSGAAGQVFYKAKNSYGSSVGTNDVALVFECQDFAPAGPTGHVEARRLYVTIEYDNALTIQVTPITDFNNTQLGQTFTLAPPGFRKRTVIEVPMAKSCTYVRIQVSVLSRAGLFWVLGARVAFRPLSKAYENLMPNS